MPKPVITAAQMVALEKSIMNYMPCLLLMEQAGQSVAEEAKKMCSLDCSVLIFCGPGNNGGDGFVTARLLAEDQYVVHVFVLGSVTKYSTDSQTMLTALAGYSTVQFHNVEELDTLMQDRTNMPIGLIIDAIFGIGLKRKIEGEVEKVIQWINDWDIPTISVDMPSGIDSDTGMIQGIAVKATSTVSFFVPKLGQVLYPGREYKGKLIIKQLVAEDTLDSYFNMNKATELMTSEDNDFILEKREMNSHKGNFGHALIVGGAPGMVGATYLCGRSAMRSGAGRVTIAVDPMVVSSLWVSLPEAMSYGWKTKKEFEKLVEGKTTIAMGMGAGKNRDRAKIVWGQVADFDGPILIDADGLYFLKEEQENINKEKPVQMILTPHPKEMAHLMDMNIADVLANVIQTAKICAERYHAVVLLKGGSCVVATPRGNVSIIASGGPMLAKGGSGDVLSGIVIALIAQGRTLYDSARYGALLLGEAGIRVPKHDATVLPTDVIEAIPFVLENNPYEERGRI